MGKLFRSRKFLLALLDVVVSLITYFVTKYVAPEAAQDVLFVLGGLQPVIIAVIIGVAVEDAAALKAGAHISQNKTKTAKPLSENGRA